MLLRAPRLARCPRRARPCWFCNETPPRAAQLSTLFSRRCSACGQRSPLPDLRRACQRRLSPFGFQVVLTPAAVVESDGVDPM
jgi:hypothetical protein